MVTFADLKNYVVSLSDVSTSFANNLDSDHFDNLLNVGIYETYRILHMVYGDDMYSEQTDLTIPAGTGTYNFATETNPDNVKPVAPYYDMLFLGGDIPFAILRFDRITGDKRYPMQRYSLSNQVLSTTAQEWDANVKYDFTPPYLRFHPLNKNTEVVRMYYVRKPDILEGSENLNNVTTEHYHLVALVAAIMLRTKEESSTTELERERDRYIETLKRTMQRDQGQALPITDVYGMNCNPQTWPWGC